MAWEDRRVLVTGADGFIGRHLTEALVKAGADVIALSASSIRPRSRGLEWVSGDITDRKTLRGICKGVDLVYHLADLPGIVKAIENPELTFRTNTFGTINLLEESCRSGVEKLVYVSSFHVYGAPKYLPVNEIHPLAAREPYAASKIASEKIVEAYVNMYRMDYAIVRPFNIFGPGHDKSFMIPDIISQALYNRAIRVGNLTPTRDFLYVEDGIEGFLAIGDRGSGVYNVGSGVETRILDVVHAIRDMVDPSLPIVSDPLRKREDRVETPRIFASVMRLGALGWKPKVGLREGLARAIDFERGQVVSPLKVLH